MLLIATQSELEVTKLEYLVAKKQAGLLPRTISAYDWHLSRMLAWLAGRGIVDVRQISRPLIREWGASLYDGWKPSTVKQAISAAKSFFRWCWEERLIGDNMADVLKTPKVKPAVQRTVTQDEFEAMLAVCPDTVKGIRDKAIISLLYDSGLRAAEAARINIADVNLTTCKLEVRVKGGAVLPGWFGTRTSLRVREWLTVRLAGRDVHNLFVGVRGITPGQAMTPGGLSKEIGKLSRKAGLSQASAHAFRRGFAVSLTEQNIPNSVLQDLGRWQSPGMIKRYTMGLAAGRAYQGHSPVDRTADNNQYG